MVLEFVLGVVGAGVTGGAVLLALEQRRFLALAVAVATVCNGILLGECAFERAVDLGVHDFDGLHGYVCSQAAATLGTDLGVGVDAVDNVYASEYEPLSKCNVVNRARCLHQKLATSFYLSDNQTLCH